MAAPVIGVADDLAGRRGLFVAGAGSGPAEPLTRVANALGWPILASPAAPVWTSPEVVRAHDALLRTDLDLQPEVIVRLGGLLSSRVAGEWLAASGAAEIVTAGERAWLDPHGTAAVVLPVAPATLIDAWLAEIDQVQPVDAGAWRDGWQQRSQEALTAIEKALASEAAPTEPGTARALVDALPAGAQLVASSSMPIRDLEWYAHPRVDLDVHANRGANGIDGVVSTAVGIALADRARPTALLIGDVAFLHDTNGLLGAADRGIDLVIVVVDNDGGGIFSFLPQADVVAPESFELLYGTPHGLDLVAVAQAFGVSARAVTDVGPAVTEAIAAGGVQVLVVRTDRAANVEVHRRLNAAVAEALGIFRRG